MGSPIGSLPVVKFSRGAWLKHISSIPLLAARLYRESEMPSLRFSTFPDSHLRTGSGGSLPSFQGCAFRQVHRLQRTFKWITIHAIICFGALESPEMPAAVFLSEVFPISLREPARLRYPAINCALPSAT